MAPGRSPVAQLAEHPAVNRRVVGSSPTRGASLCASPVGAGSVFGMTASRIGAERHLEWDGCANAHDLGGFRGALGTTLWGAVVRSDNLDDLTDAGWGALPPHGIATIADLRAPSD